MDYLWSSNLDKGWSLDDKWIVEANMRHLWIFPDAESPTPSLPLCR
jgi:hypothetical protein